MRAERIIPIHLHDRVDQELESGERVLWMDMPIPIYFTPAGLGYFLFSIAFTAFAILWIVLCVFVIPQGEDGPPSLGFTLFSTPFILAGLVMLTSPLRAYRRALRTMYVITDRRAITFSGGFSSTIRSYPPSKLQNVHRREKKNGSGDVLFAEHTWTDSDGDRQNEELGFLRIRHPREVQKMLKILAEQAACREQAES
jgi:hypothetical protein